MTASRPGSTSDRGAVAPDRPAAPEAGLEGHLDTLCRAAAELFAVPMAMVALVDEDRFRFRARYGIAADAPAPWTI